MISDMLKVENIKIMQRVDHWQDAIHISLEDLVKGGFVTDNYEKAIIKSTEEYGPYYVLAEDFALIHGRPTDGVNERQLAITLLREPVKFSEDSYPVRVLIALAAIDSDSHIDAIKVLSNIFINEEKVDQLVKAEKPEEIYDLLIQQEKEIQEG